MADDTQVAAHVLNQQLQIAFGDVGFSFSENLHVNETSYTATTPSHFAEQGTYTETYGDGTISGKFSFTANANHLTDITDFLYVHNGNSYQYHSTYTSNGSGVNIVDQVSVNGGAPVVSHYDGHF